MANKNLTEPIAIVLVCDDKYVRHAATTIVSVVKNSTRIFDFYIFDCGIRPENIEKLKSWRLGPNRIKIVPMTKIEVFERFKMRQRWTSAIFYRLVIPEVLPNLDKAIYMDSDLIVFGDLGEIWDTPMQEHILGAVPEEPQFKDKELFKIRKRTLGMAPESAYFNSGLLLFNIKAFQTSQLTQRIIEFLNNNAHNKYITLPDQDALNVLIDRTKFLSLPLKFNQLINASHEKTRAEKPCILHLVNKPWKYPPYFAEHFLNKIYPYCSEYFRYARMTPWGNEATQDASLWETFRCLWKFYLNPVERFVKCHIFNKIKNHIFQTSLSK